MKKPFIVPFGAILSFALLLAVYACQQPRELQSSEGFIEVPGGKVWYKVEGSGTTTPLVLLHGGPGAGSYYMESLGQLSNQRPVVFYDQLGSGRSDHPTDESLWEISRAIEELERVRQQLGLEKVHLLGHSWGAMLAIEYLLTDPTGVESVILASMTPSVEQWTRDSKNLVATLPDSIQAIIKYHEEAGTTDSEPYQMAIGEFYKRYLSLKLQDRTPPAALDSTFKNFGYEVYSIMWGPSEFTATGKLKDWDARDRLKNIRIPALVTVGDQDEMSVESAQDMVQRLPNARLQVIKGSAHLTMLDQPVEYAQVVRSFLQELEGE